MDTNFKEKVNVDAIAITLSDPDHEYFKALNISKKLKFEKERLAFASLRQWTLIDPYHEYAKILTK